MLTGMPRFWLGTTLLLGLVGSLDTAYGQGSKSKETDKKLIKATIEGELTGKAANPLAGSRSKIEEAPVSFTISKAKGEDGRELTEMAGKILTLDKGKRRDELLKKYKPGDKVILLGKVDVEKSVLQLESFKEASGSDSK